MAAFRHLTLVKFMKFYRCRAGCLKSTTKKTSGTLLETYLGGRTGKRVLEGQIKQQ
ncbi:MAG: hypothetical protein QF394_00935 [Rhodospirillales bacterium]|jgi:hypothetical protein|nr:hypothetical protein [Rhodospirillales bacterium]MDP7623704.1 hypothetical protein [Rhodospirillales bacterium]